MLYLKCFLVEFYDKIDGFDLILFNNNLLNCYIYFLKSCDFLSDVIDVYILVVIMKYFEMILIDDSLINNKFFFFIVIRVVKK